MIIHKILCFLFRRCSAVSPQFGFTCEKGRKRHYVHTHRMWNWTPRGVWKEDRK